MDSLKKFIGKKKADVKFKAAGPGHKLSDASSSSSKASGSASRGSGPGQVPKQPAAAPSEERRQAALAALARVEKTTKQKDPNDLLANRQLAFIKEQAKKQIEAEQKLKDLDLRKATESEEPEETIWGKEYEEGKETNPELYAVSGVYFSCPMIGPEVLPRHEVEMNILQFLLEQPEEELGSTSCLMIHSCNSGRDKVKACVDVLSKYMDNIIQNPQETKFHKIRCNNKVFQEKVANIVGVPQFLKSAGFKQLITTENGGEEEEFYIFEPFDNCVGALTELRNLLQSTLPIRPELDRNTQVLMPAQVVQRKELPPEFYTLTPEELKREQKLRSQMAERELTLRTKAQRERDEVRDRRLYRYAVIRVRFPDGFTLQGTFNAGDKLGDAYEFVHDSLSESLENCVFSLRQARGQNLANLDASLMDERLPPASILNFKLESGTLVEGSSFLKQELIALVQATE